MHGSMSLKFRDIDGVAFGGKEFGLPAHKGQATIGLQLHKISS